MEKQTYRFEDIFDLEALQELMDALAQAFEVGIGVRTPTGERIIRDSFYVHFCADVIWQTEEGKLQCGRSDQDIITASYRENSPYIRRCQSGGLIDAGIKIVIEGMHIATILVGQVRLEEEQLTEEEYREIARNLGVDEEIYLRKIKEFPLKTKEKFDSILKALSLIADQLSLMGYNNLHQRQRIGSLESKESMLQALAEKDTLTGLWNRRKFDASLKLYEETEDQTCIALVSGDANNLKLMNDIFGHEAGDKMLRYIAQAMTTQAKEEWIVARCGGDEFHVLMQDVPLRVAQVYCDRVSNSCKNDKRLNFPLSIAFGAAEWDRKTETLQECLQRADAQMYENKKKMKQQENLLDYILERMYDRCYIYRENIAAETELAYKFALYLGLDEERASQVRTAAKYQDIGMIKLPANFVLRGPSRTPEEYEAVKGHVTNGYNMALQFENTHKIAEFVLFAHENWDGNSYPRGLKGQEIPLESRIIRLVNNYCNWVVPNAKKANVNRETAAQRLRDRAGVMFDPDMVDGFLAFLDKSP